MISTNVLRECHKLQSIEIRLIIRAILNEDTALTGIPHTLVAQYRKVRIGKVLILDKFKSSKKGNVMLYMLMSYVYKQVTAQAHRNREWNCIQEC